MGIEGRLIEPQLAGAMRRHLVGWLSTLMLLLVTLIGSPAAVAAGADATTTGHHSAVYAYDGSTPNIALATRNLAARPGSSSMGQVLQSSTRLLGVAANGGAAAVRTGQAGEAAVRSMYDIGPKASAEIGGRTRIFDGLNDVAVSEVKNVARQSYTLQLRDSLAYAQSTGRQFDLYVRPDTYLTGPLRDAIGNGDIVLRFIP